MNIPTVANFEHCKVGDSLLVQDLDGCILYGIITKFKYFTCHYGKTDILFTVDFYDTGNYFSGRITGSSMVSTTRIIRKIQSPIQLKETIDNLKKS